MHGKSIHDLQPHEIEKYIYLSSQYPITQRKDADFHIVDSTVRTNYLSHFWTIKAFLPGMLRLQKGTIVTISSVVGHVGPKFLTDYASTKAAATTLHYALTADLGGANAPIKTLLVEPGQMSTNLFAGVETPSNFFAPVLEPVDVAKEIIAAIDAGTGGVLAMPTYSRWIHLMKVLPVSVQRLVKWWSGCDEAMQKRKTIRQRLYYSDDEDEIVEEKGKPDSD